MEAMMNKLNVIEADRIGSVAGSVMIMSALGRRVVRDSISRTRRSENC